MDTYYQSISEDEWQRIEEDDDEYDYTNCVILVHHGGIGGDTTLTPCMEAFIIQLPQPNTDCIHLYPARSTITILIQVFKIPPCSCTPVNVYHYQYETNYTFQIIMLCFRAQWSLQLHSLSIRLPI